MSDIMRITWRKSHADVWKGEVAGIPTDALAFEIYRQPVGYTWQALTWGQDNGHADRPTLRDAKSAAQAVADCLAVAFVGVYL